VLTRLFPSKPFSQVSCEYYVNYKGTRLFFDFYVKKLKLLVEVQGRQHTEFVKHFHGDKKAFLQQRARDNLKRVWVEENDFHLIRVNYNEKITEELILEKITKAMESEDGFYE
jgi:very-short-patch-repair endonuclease